MSLSCTTVYLIFYSMDAKTQENLESFNYMGLLVFIYFLSFAFMGGELSLTPAYFYWIFLTFLLLVANLILVNYKFGRYLSFWITLGWLAFLFILGIAFANKH